MDYRFWLPTAVNCCGLALMYWQIRLQRRSLAGAAGRRSRLTKGQRYWPVLATACLVALSWLPYFWLPIYVIQEPLIMSWGTVTNGVQQAECRATLNGSRLHEFATSYRVVLICGFSSARVDRLSDSLVTISPVFTVEDHAISIQAPMSSLTMRAIAAAADPAVVATGRPYEIQAPIWYDAALVPKNVDIEAVHSEADLERVGGKLFPNELRTQIAPVRIR